MLHEVLCSIPHFLHKIAEKVPTNIPLREMNESLFGQRSYPDMVIRRNKILPLPKIKSGSSSQ
jgi:hypothetical protein